MTDVEPRVVVRGEVIAANVLHFTRLLRRAGGKSKAAGLRPDGPAN